MEKSNDGKCGEMSAAQIWQRLHPGQLIRDAKILTVSVKEVEEKDEKGNKVKIVTVWPPCPDGPTVRLTPRSV